MSDSTKKGDAADPLAAALNRAEQAVSGGRKPPVAPKAAPAPTSFGEIELDGGGEDDSLELDGAVKKKKPAIKKPALVQGEEWQDGGWADGNAAAPTGGDDPLPDVGAQAKAQPRPTPPQPRGPAKQPAAPQTPSPAAARTPAERPGPFVRVSMPDQPRTNWAKLIKISLIVLLSAGAIGGGVFGFIKWRESVKAEEQAQLDALDQGSLDRLKSDALKKERLGS